ncbi:hypothetical protein RPMA_09805 [Tardiphaga alba]|uniref:Methyltransferase family protein n=1 Tax=Tardiphaga alba TaxID=340268 RepID=A0ABX8A784_9BRAD|nr:hypothetical protein [Tardiphaga alba]QUS39097.1 hypothetical protein RPMA_09805 [Tardiphaga alba]
MSSSKYNRGIRFAELLLRQEAILTREYDWQPLDFEGKHVVEIGCGPLAGFGPLAIFRGAASFQSAEPEWDPALFFESAQINDKYLRIFHADLTALYGPRMDFEQFRSALRARLSIYNTGFEAAQIKAPVDIVLSQSVLEHVFPPRDIVRQLASIQSPTTRFLHLVDFGNHYPTVNPFQGLYEQEPEAYVARRGQAINLLRMPDIAALFASENISARVVATRFCAESYTGSIAPWWRRTYDDSALFTQLALVASAH